MKIKILNGAEAEIAELVRILSGRYFEGVETEVGIFQSEKYGFLKWTENGQPNLTPAMVIPREEFDRLKRVSPEIEELNDIFKLQLPYVIWFGGILPRHPHINPQHVVAHEMQHVRQREDHPRALAQDRVLSFFLPTRQVPAEIDANYFADLTMGLPADETYNWTAEAERLFTENLKKIAALEARLGRQAADEDKRALFEYYLKSARNNL